MATSQPPGKQGSPGPKFSTSIQLLLAATIIVVELPTAFPYFAAIAAVLGSGVNAACQVLVLALFNLCFVLPLVAILVILLIAGDQAQNFLQTGASSSTAAGRDWRQCCFY